MNVWYIALWVYMVVGEAVLLAVAFNICRKQVKKSPAIRQKQPPQGVKAS